MEQTNTSNSKQLPRSRAVFAEAWHIFKKRFWILQAISWLPMLILLVAGLIVSVVLLGLGISQGGLINAEALLDNPLFMIPAIVVFVSLLLLGWAISAWGQVALIFGVARPELNVRQSYAESGPRLVSFIWISVLTGLAMFAGFVLLIMPGIYLAVALAFSIVVAALENERGLGALVRSYEYVRGNWWRVLRYGVFMALVGLVAYVPALLLGFAVDDTPAQFLSEIANRVTGLVFAPLGAAYLWRVYTHVRDSKGEVVVTDKRKKQALGLIILGMVVAAAVFAAILIIAVRQGMQL